VQAVRPAEQGLQLAGVAVSHSMTLPLWPWSWVAVRLSLAFTMAFAHSAWVLPWQPSQNTPPCPLLKRYRIEP